MASMSAGGGAPVERLSLGFLVHALLSCAQADASRDFLCEHPEVRRQLFTVVQARGGFAVGSVAACAGDAGIAGLLAGLAMLTAAAGGSARRELLRHICAHGDAYLTLLLPHQESSVHAAQLLSSLAACSEDEADALGSADALAYLRLLAALAERLACLSEGEPAAGSSLSSRRAALAAAAFGSVVSLTATLEGGLREEAARELTAGRQQKSLAPEQLQAEIDKRVRQRLPAAEISAAVAAAHRIARRHMAALLDHSHPHCSSLVVALLRLDLLQLRLPPPQQVAMHAVVAVLQQGHTLGARLHASLEQALASSGAAPGESGAMQLLQVLSTAKASLRCLQAAAGSGLFALQPGASSGDDAQVQQARVFAASLLCMAHGAPASDARTMQLLWQLALRPRSSTPATRKASDILLWAIAPPLAALQPTLQARAVETFFAADVGPQLAAHASSATGALPSAFRWELAQALISSPACAGSAHDLAILRAALAAQARRQLWDAPGPSASEAQPTLDRLSSANLEALDGFVERPSSAGGGSAAPARAAGSPAAPARAPGGSATPAPAAGSPPAWLPVPAGPSGRSAAAVSGAADALGKPAGSSMQPGSGKAAEVAGRQRQLEELKRRLAEKKLQAAAAAAQGSAAPGQDPASRAAGPDSCAVASATGAAAAPWPPPALRRAQHGQRQQATKPHAAAAAVDQASQQVAVAACQVAAEAAAWGEAAQAEARRAADEAAARQAAAAVAAQRAASEAAARRADADAAADALAKRSQQLLLGVEPAGAQHRVSMAPGCCAAAAPSRPSYRDAAAGGPPMRQHQRPDPDPTLHQLMPLPKQPRRQAAHPAQPALSHVQQQQQQQQQQQLAEPVAALTPFQPLTPGGLPARQQQQQQQQSSAPAYLQPPAAVSTGPAAPFGGLATYQALFVPDVQAAQAAAGGSTAGMDSVAAANDMAGLDGSAGLAGMTGSDSLACMEVDGPPGGVEPVEPMEA